MKTLRLLAGLLTLVMLLMPLGCSDFDEMQSQSMLNKAKTLLEEGQEVQGEAVLAELVGKYPDTQSATAARQKLRQIQTRRDFLERQEFAKILDSYRQVFTGYRTVYSDLPGTIEDFDQSGYFFDSSYLEEITPKEFQVYLLLTGQHNLFQAWCVRSDKENSYFVDGASPSLKKLKRDQVLAEMQEHYEVLQQKGSLFLIRPKS